METNEFDLCYSFIKHC